MASKPKAKAKSGGRSKYDSVVLPNLDKIQKWTTDGATVKEIAKKLKIGYSTLKSYLDRGRAGDERYLALTDAYARACEIPDDEVEAALFRRACGYEYTEVTTEEKMDREGNVHTLTKKITKDIPADVLACEFWLANRRRDKWSYKPAPEDGEGETGGGVVILAPAGAIDPHPDGGEPGGDGA